MPKGCAPEFTKIFQAIVLHGLGLVFSPGGGDEKGEEKAFLLAENFLWGLGTFDPMKEG